MRSNHWIIGDDEISAEEGSWTLDPWIPGICDQKDYHLSGKTGIAPEVFPHFQRYRKLF